MQGATLRDLNGRSRELARATGFLARLLLAHPLSMQRTRFYREPPSEWPALGTFGRRLRELLDATSAPAADGSLAPSLLTLSPAASATWSCLTT